MSQLPSDAIRITQYSELSRYLHAFATGRLNLLILLGRQGVGKTESVKAILGLAGERCDAEASGSPHEALYIAGYTSAFFLYQQLWEFRNAPVVIDDLDRLYAQPDCVRLLKQLCNSGVSRQISWFSRAAESCPGLPNIFDTRSPVTLVGNTWRTLSDDVKALEDRAIVLHFDPSSIEVHRAVGIWFDDPVVHGFIGAVLQDIPKLSIRHYLKGQALRCAGFPDWQATLMTMLLADPILACVARLQRDTSLVKEDERVQHFVNETGRSRATYFRLKRQLRSNAGDSSGSGSIDQESASQEERSAHLSLHEHTSKFD